MTTVGAVMELYEMGVLTKDQLGIEAPFGSAPVAQSAPRDFVLRPAADDR
jgi:hypothetical protein